MGDKKKKIIKYIIILICIIIVAVATIVLQALNTSPVFAKSILAKSPIISRDDQVDKIDIYDYITILPSNYNQGLEFKADNEKVEINNNGEVKFLEDVYSVTITVFVKTNQNKMIFTSFEIILEDCMTPTIEKDLIKIYEDNVNNIYTNKLNFNKNSEVSVVSLNNLVNYDFVTGNLTINENILENQIYDKITIEVKSQGFKTTLSFEVCIIKELKYILDDEFCVIQFKNTLDNDNEYINILVENSKCLMYIAHRDSDATFKFLCEGSTTVEISCSCFKYLYKITIIQTT